jgi:hypothetical protein
VKGARAEDVHCGAHSFGGGRIQFAPEEVRLVEDAMAKYLNRTAEALRASLTKR